MSAPHDVGLAARAVGYTGDLGVSLAGVLRVANVIEKWRGSDEEVFLGVLQVVTRCGIAEDTADDMDEEVDGLVAAQNAAAAAVARAEAAEVRAQKAEEALALARAAPKWPVYEALFNEHAELFNAATELLGIDTYDVPSWHLVRSSPEYEAWRATAPPVDTTTPEYQAWVRSHSKILGGAK